MPSSNDIYQARIDMWEQRRSQGMETTKQFATMNIEAIKDKLCVCTTEEAPKLQGKVEAYKDILQAITAEPTKID